MTGAVRMSVVVTGKPASASAAAIDARVREVVFVTRASGIPAARSQCRPPSASYAPRPAASTILVLTAAMHAGLFSRCLAGC